jgi:DNA-binding NarL/FixJ family response regulator
MTDMTLDTDETTLTTVRIAIVDDHGIVRQGLRALLSRPGIEVIAEGENGAEAVQIAQELAPDVILLDIRMKDGDGLTFLPQIKDAAPETAVIILTTYNNPSYLVQAINSGADGFLSKETAPERIVRAIRAAAAGDELIDRTLLAATLGQVNGDALDTDPSETILGEDLSEREIQVLQLMASGLTNAQIAEQLTIGVTTVKTHVQHIFQKLHVSDRTQASLWAVRNGIA